MHRLLLLSLSLVLATQAQTVTPAPQHQPNFEAERKQADELFLATKPLEALPLYEDLCRQDPTVAVFAERHAAGLIAKEGTLSDPAARLKVHVEAMNELRRALRLGDNSDYVRILLNADARTLLGAITTGVPLSVGYTYHGSPDAQTPFKDGEAAFARSDWPTAVLLYSKAATLDHAWYDAALFTGDTYFRQKDTANAALWFAKAVAIDPNRETAYRYWGDALFHAGDRDGAREKFVQAVVAEPYSMNASAELEQWTKHTGHQYVKPAITRPEFITPDGELKIDPALQASTQDGRSAWIVYQQYRVAHGARVLNQLILSGGSDKNAVVTTTDYRHTIAEEHAALRAMLAEIDTEIRTGTVTEANLDPNLRNIRALEAANMLGAWIAISAADAGIRSDYPEYRAHHRKHLLDYVNNYTIR